MREIGAAVVTPADCRSLLDRVASVWTAEGIEHTFEHGTRDEGREVAVIGGGRERTALRLSCDELRRAGAQVCYERTPSGWSVFAFPAGTQGLRLDVRRRHRGLASRLGSVMAHRPRMAPFVAIVGPDGVGKSTVMQLIRERLGEQAPFLELASFQWRPGLLPPLSRLAGKPEQTGPSAFKPRREPGRMQLIRIGYYFLDYLLGSWWKLRKSPKPRLILFDRCALDMEVDPVRFGLRSATGLRTLWRAVPRPACVILLHDDPQRIAQRKDDLEEHEIRTQLSVWLRMASEDRVDSVVEVDSSPHEVANRVYQVLIDTFVDSHEQDCPAGGETGIARVIQIFDGGSQKNGFSTYAALPGRDNARVLIPLGAPRAAAASGLKIYNAQRPAARVAKAATRYAFRTGMAQPLWRSTVLLPNAALEQRLKAALGDGISLSIALGSGAERERVVIQATRPDGSVAAYVKAGTGEAAISSLRHEERVLRSLEGARFESALVPEVLGAFDFGGTRVLAQSAPPGYSSAAPDRLSALHSTFLTDLCHYGGSPMELALPPAIADELGRAGCPHYAHQVEWATRELSSSRLTVRSGFAHADFAPWNLLLSGRRLFVFDWEFAREGMPPAYDLFHFSVATAVELHGLGPGVIFEDTARSGGTNAALRRYLEATGIEYELWRPLLIWYLSDALASSVTRLGARVGSKEAAMRHAWSALLMLARYQSRSPQRSAR